MPSKLPPKAAPAAPAAAKPKRQKGPNKAAQLALQEAVDALPVIDEAFFAGFTPWQLEIIGHTPPAPAAPRPMEYSAELVDVICTRIANGEVLSKIFADPAMPCRKTFYNWRKDHPEAQTAYLLAKEVQVEGYVEETIEIADERASFPEQVARNKLRVAARQWYAEKLVPKVYGQKIGIGGAEGLPPVQSEGHVDVDLTLTPAEAYRRMSQGG